MNDPGGAALWFPLTAEREQLRSAVAELLAGERFEPQPAGEPATRTAAGLRTWQRLAGEIGAGAVSVPADRGGAGGSVLDAAVVLAETGASLSPVPYLSTTCVLWAVALLDDPAVLTDLAAGASPAAIALLDPSGAEPTGPDAGTRVRARTTGGQTVLDGEYGFVLDGGAAERLLVVAFDGHGAGLYVVPAEAAGVTRAERATLDPTRGHCSVRLREVPAERVGEPGFDTAAAAIDVLRIALAVESAGAAARCLLDTVAYLGGREQFRRPLATFQALQHRCAQLAVDVEGAISTAWHAAGVLEAALAREPLPEEGDLTLTAALSKAVCADVFHRVAAESIQLHGGLGFTWEHRAHLFFKRATANRLLYGSSAQLRRLIGERSGLLAAPGEPG